MNKLEQQFWRTELREGFRALGHCCRVESHATSIGISDVNLKVPGPDWDWWIEIKVAHPPGDEVAILPTQWGWHKKRRKAGGHTAFLIKWDRPEEPIYTFSASVIPWTLTRIETWHSTADLVMVGFIDWFRLTEELRNAED
jgi:hypothetical protein